MVTDNKIDLIGSTFADHVPKYFQPEFNLANKQLADEFLTGIYGSVSPNIFWAPERVLDDETLTTIRNMGYTHVFADQMRHLLKWFGRSSALGTAGYRLNRVNDINIIPIHDVASEYLNQTLDQGSAMAVRQLLSRRARSSVQDQVAVLWTDIGEFSGGTKVASYDANVRWLGSRPWIRVVTAQQIADNQVSYVGEDRNTYTTWGTEARGTGQDLRQTAKDWVDWATRENYDNWFNKLSSNNFGANTNFGRVGVGGHANAAWNAVNSVSSLGLQKVARAAIGGAMFQSAFHFPSVATDLRKFSTGDYINPANNTETLADFAKNTQGQARFARVYGRVQEWASTANTITPGKQAQDIDLDGQEEYLLYNSRIFAVFEAKGGRMTAAWLRDPNDGKIWQVAGNFASYANTDSEDEGASNVTVSNGITSVNAYRTSGFKDWYKIGGNAGAGANADVNATYTVSASGTAAWTFSQGGISKTVSLPNNWSGDISAAYALSGPSRLYVRFGLSPNLLDLMKNGQANLQTSLVGNERFNLLNNSPSDSQVRAFVKTSAGSTINNSPDVTDKAASFTTVNMRNQAQTHQVEVEITGNTTIVLGFDQGTDFQDPATQVTDGIPNTWWNENGIPTNERVAAADRDGDGLTNMEEYILGSNPNNASSGRPQVAATHNGETFRIEFPTVAGRTYRVMGRDGLGSGSWTEVTNVQQGTGLSASPVTGDGTTKVLVEQGVGSKPARFYRVDVQLAP
jgi:hypothetical protein